MNHHVASPANSVFSGQPRGFKIKMTEIRKRMHLDPSCDPKNLTQDMREELLEELLEDREKKEISVRPNNRSAAKAADVRIKNLSQEVSIPVQWQ